MRILIHGVAMRKQGGGSRHLRGFIDALGKLDQRNEYLLCLDRQFEFISSYANVRVLPVTIRSQWQRFWWDQVVLSKLAREQQVDLILAIFVFGAYRPPVPQIVFQRNPLFFCRHYLKTVAPLSKWGLEIRLRRQMAYWTMRGSDAIVVPSHAMRQMILNYCPQAPMERFHVIPHAFDETHFKSGQPLSTDSQAQVDRAANAARILYVSHLEPHKDVQTAIRTAHQLKRMDENFRLLLTLDSRDDPHAYEAFMTEIRQIGLDDVVVNLGRVPEDQIYQLYRQTDIFLFPSLCESFGFPMKEALLVGLPIVASDTAINREICGDAALYFAPRDSNAAAVQVSRLLGDKVLTEQFRTRARARFGATTSHWDEYTQAILALIHATIDKFHSNV